MHLLPAVASGTPTLNTIHHTDALTLLKALPDDCIDCCVSSPPYWNLRDYEVDGQIGLEPSPAEFIARLMEIYSELRRALKPSGTVWVNLGDSYASGEIGRHDSVQGRAIDGKPVTSKAAARQQSSFTRTLPAKSLMMIPARFAIAMQDDGWILRSDIIWHKTSPMPESVTDRPTKAHEYVYLFAKEGRYWYDADSVKEKANPDTQRSKPVNATEAAGNMGNTKRTDFELNRHTVEYRNLRTVWTINPEPFADAHFAVMPSKLVETCIKAGCPPGGVVLDMFMGSGTVAITARRLGRHYIGCDLNHDYVAMARRRLAQSDPFQSREVAPGLIQKSMFSGMSV